MKSKRSHQAKESHPPEYYSELVEWTCHCGLVEVVTRRGQLIKRHCKRCSQEKNVNQKKRKVVENEQRLNDIHDWS